MAVSVYLGARSDLPDEPSSRIMLLKEPATLAGARFLPLEMQIYGFDKTMAPEGKGVIKVELTASYSYWKKLSTNRADYETEKQSVAAQVIGLLENHFPGISDQVEVTDVSTLLTWERFMGGTHGFVNSPTRSLVSWAACLTVEI